jgi:hypothetical protein
MKAFLTAVAIFAVAIITACATQPPDRAANSSQTPTSSLTPINIQLRRGHGLYAVPGCSDYQRPSMKRNSFLIPTAQEAEMAGFRPYKECETLATQRIAAETAIFGKMEPTPISELWRAQLYSVRLQTNLESQQTDLDEQQAETKSEQEGFTEKQNELEERQDDVEKILKP